MFNPGYGPSIFFKLYFVNSGLTVMVIMNTTTFNYNVKYSLHVHIFTFTDYPYPFGHLLERALKQKGLSSQPLANLELVSLSLKLNVAYN